MEDKSQNQRPELSARQQWRNLWNALSEETTVEQDVSYPQAEQVKHELLQGLAHDARAHITPSEISSAPEQTGRVEGTEGLHWPEAKEPEQPSGSKTQAQDVKPERDTDRDR